jgi:hypothetical protein
MTGKGQRREVEELFFGKKLDVVVVEVLDSFMDGRTTTP